jgi:nitrous oxidase accessory protein|tara:strand:+ start:184 stop:2508 length:2325 start_codon:yes stop_codon:yes gene_type:complete
MNLLDNKKKLSVFCFALLLSVIFVSSNNLYADELNMGLIVSQRGNFSNLEEAISNSEDGDILNVYAGEYDGPINIYKSIELIGHNKPVINGKNKGTVVKLTAPNIVFKGFHVKNSGKVLDEENSGIAIESTGVIVEGNELSETLFGIYLKRASNSVIRENTIISKDLDLPRRGDPIRIWFSDNVIVEKNKAKRGRDVVLWYSEHLLVTGNTFSEGRYGLHFMYCDDAIVEKNQLVDNSVGAFFMYSRNLKLKNNYISQNKGPSGFGVGLKDMDDAVITNNLIMDNRIGVSIDNSPRQIDSTEFFEGNLISFNDIGIRFSPSVKRNQFKSNSFKDNQEQVSIAGGGGLEDNYWSIDGIGNYWSDYVGFDKDQDGIGDMTYKSQKLFENLMDRNPELRLFLYSPSAQSIDFAAKSLPTVRPKPKLVDTAPLMKIYIPSDIPIKKIVNSSSLFAIASSGIIFAFAGIFFLPRLSPTFIRNESIELDGKLSKPLKITKLTKKFGSITIFKDLDFTINPGESVAIWGDNGVGKTTIFYCILGLLSHQGSVNIGNLNVKSDSKKIRRMIGFVPQELNLHEDLSVNETIKFYAKLNKIPLTETQKYLIEMNLLEHSNKLIRQLSGGMKQRLALAIALLPDPPIVILDEPTANLDARSRSSFLSLVFKLKQRGKTLIFSSHRVEEIKVLSDKVLILERGKKSKVYDSTDLEKIVNLDEKIRFFIDEENILSAYKILTNKGYLVEKYHNSIVLSVEKTEKIKPIKEILDKKIKINNFEIEKLN